MTYRLGVDTGGTFTDVVMYDEETGTVTTAKTPSTPAAFDEGVLTGTEKALDRAGTTGDAIEFFSHATTVGTNAVLENEIPELGLITNEGLRDVLEIGDQRRPELYDLQVEKPPHLIPRRYRREVPGRIDAAGTVVDELDTSAVRDAVSFLADQEVEAIVVSMLFSHLNDSHERRVGEIIEEHAADIEYSLSSEVHPEIREYERTITTVLNQAIKRTIESYLDRLETGIADLDIPAPLNVMHSGGGIFGARQAADNAIRTMLSGPAAGAVATQDIAATEGYADAIGMDMGGTSADVSLVNDGDLVRSTEGEINDLPVKTPMIDINTVGAGGGSIAWIDDGGALRVGPRSAGASPGPICYDRGGTEPTLTDANVLLGRLSSEQFLDGDMPLAVERTRERFKSAIADPRESTVASAAASVVDVAVASLVREIRRVTVERGIDPETFALVAFGGAGPLHAPFVADELDIQTVIIPRSPGVFSARGLLIADVRIDESQAYAGQEIDVEQLRTQFDALEAVLADRFSEQGFSPDETEISRSIDVRYDGQAYELTVPVDGGVIDQPTVEAVESRFHEQHARRYGHAMQDEPIEFVTLRVEGTVPTASMRDERRETTSDAQVGEREVYFDGAVQTAAIYDRRALGQGTSIDGPAILEESGSTTALPPGAVGTVTDAGSIRIDLGEGE